MKKKQHKPDGATNLREKAEHLLQGEPAAATQMPEADLAAVLHELRVHQIELEMQNEELRRAHAELEESRSQYADLFDFAPIGYLIIDPRGIVVQANLTAAALLKVDRRDLPDKPLAVFLEKVSQDTWRSHYLTLFKTGEAQESEIELQRTDHAYLVVRVRSEPVKNGDGKVVQCRSALTNITSLARAEQRLKESEQRFRTLAENAPDIIARVDRRMHILYINRPVEAALGIRPEEFVGRTFEELGVPESLTGKWTAAVNGVFQTARTDRLDFDCPTPQGLRHYSAIVVPEFAANRSVETVLVTVRDITDRVRAEEKYSTVIRNVQDGFCILDAEGRYIEVNEACCRMLGWSCEELLRMKVLDVWQPEQPAELKLHLQKALQDGADKFQMKHRRKDGCRLDCDVTVQRLNGDRLFVFARDITEQRRAEEERMAALQRLELVARATNDGIWDWDLATDALWHNEALLTTFGYPADEPEGSTQWWRDHIHPQDREAVLAGLEEVLRDGQDRWSARYRFRRHDGTYAWVMARGWALRDEQGRAVRMVGSMTDLSERLGLLDQLENEKGKLETILETAQSGIVVVDEQARITYANPVVRNFYGQIPFGEDIESHLQLGMCHPDGTPYEPRDMPLVRSALDGATVTELEVLIRRPGGEDRYVIMDTNPLRDRADNVIGAVGIFHDITELRRAEQAIREARDQLEERVHERTTELDETVATLQEEVAERMQAQGQLARQNEVLQTIVNSIPAMLVFYDAEGRVRLVNEEFTRILGYTVAELQQAGVMELRFPDPTYRQEAREFIEAAQGGWRDFLVQCKNADQIISSWTGVRLADGSLMEVGIDIRERRQFEDRLRESEQRYRTLVELAPDAIGVERDGRFVFVNSTAARLFGARTPEEIVGRPVLDFIPPDRRQRVERHFRNLDRRRKPLSMVEEAVLRLDGVAVEVELSAIPILFENQRANQVVLRDITHRKEIENRLRENARQLQQQAELLDLAHDSIIVNDMEGRIAFWNHGAEQTYGWTREEALGQISHELLQTRFPLNLIEITAKLLSKGRWNGELTHTTRAGQTIIVSTRWALQRDEESRPTGILMIDRDITQQKRAELATREARQFAENVTNTVRESLLVLDRELRVISANQTFYRQFAVAPAETEGRYIYEIGNRQWDIPELRRLLEDILPHNTSFEDFEVEHEFENMGRRTMLLNARRIQAQTGETETILLAIDDITIRKEQERRIHEHQEQLAVLTEELLLAEERERRRLAVVLHDSIGQSLAFSKRELGVVQKNAPEPVKEAIDYVKKQIDEAIRQTRSLTFELSPSTLHTFGLEAAVEELAEQFAQREGFRYHFEATDENQPLGEQIKTLLYRATRELLTNVARHAEATDVSIRIGRTDQGIRLVVQDNGKGFDVTRLEQAAGHKEGFGLFSIRERLSYIGGAFEIESAPGQGTKVTLTAPLRLSNQGRLRSGKS
jgi:PAS domain S-box-containing protein